MENEQVDDQVLDTEVDATTEVAEQSETLNAETGAAKDPASAVQDIEFELPGQRKVKQSDILAWEKSHQNAKRIEADYTKKTQSLAQQRKSFEQTFGRFPEPGELQALGKLYKSYSDPRAQKLIDAVLSGKYDDVQATPGKTLTPVEQEVASLKEKLSQFEQSQQERYEAETRANSAKVWNGWASGMKSKGVEITEEIDKAMSPFISAIASANPEMELNEVLDEAYEHATLRQTRQKAIKEVLVNSGKAQKTGKAPITSKAGSKPDSEKSYSEIMAEGRNG